MRRVCLSPPICPVISSPLSPARRFTRYHRGELNYPQDDVATEFDDLTETFWAQRGLKRYEVSNYAKPGYESRLLSYWFYEPTLGVGPGAHGRPVLAGKKRREVTHRHPETWLKLFKNGHGLKEFRYCRLQYF